MLVLVALISYGYGVSLRPARTDLTQPLFAGITYQRQALQQPRPMVIHILAVDLTTPGLRLVVSPDGVQNGNQADVQAIARTTSQFLQDSGVQIATNGSFFYPFRENTPWDYGPQTGDVVNPVGLAIANGTTYAPPQDRWHPVCFLSDAGQSQTQISPTSTCPDSTTAAIAGFPLLIMNGQPQPILDPPYNADDPYPRSVIATNEEGDRLWLIAIDGKQPFYSDGATLAEATAVAMRLGASAALNLDGGGSTTLVAAQPAGPTLLNAPIHTKLPMRERAIANHIGIYAPSL